MIVIKTHLDITRRERICLNQISYLTSFDFIAEVVCESNPQSSGFLMTVKIEGANEER